MKRILKTFTALFAFGCLATVRAQSVYTTPYSFVTIAGVDTVSADANGTNASAHFGSPYGITADTNGTLYVVDFTENTVRKMVPAGTNWVVTTIAGLAGTTGSADGLNSAARFNQPVGITIDSLGQLYVTDSGYNIIRKLTLIGSDWSVTTIAGTAGIPGSADGTNGSASFYNPYGITVDSQGIVYVADYYNSTIRKITPAGTNWVTTTIAGVAQNFGSADGTNSAALFEGPSAITVDAAGNLFVADTLNSTIRKISPVGTNWVVTTIAGQTEVYSSDDGTNRLATFNNPNGIDLDNAGNLYVTDTLNHTIRKLTPAGTNWVVSTLAGLVSDSASVDGIGSSARFRSPYGIVADGSGNLFVADPESDTIRKGQSAAALPVPNLTVSLTALNSVVVAWPNTGTFTLQTNSDLATTNWAGYGGSFSTSNGTNSTTFAPLIGNLFFRLTH